MVNFLDLKVQYEGLRAEIDQAVLRVLASARFALGPEVEAFENDFAEYQGAKHCIAVNSGTSALHLALLAAGIGPGDEVITVPNTFVATAAAIDYTGAKTVLVDVDATSYTIDITKIEAAITPRTKAILPVHLYGQPADMDPLMAIAKKHDLLVIEDAAQAHGAEYKGRRVGSIGHLGCFSFYPGKNLGAYGEGGAITTNSADYTALTRSMRDWGQSRKHLHDVKGFNYRMDAFQGAILKIKLAHLEKWTEARRAHAKGYGELITATGVQTPVEMSTSRHVYHIYGIRVSGRDDLSAWLQERKVYTGMHYPIPLHLQKVFTHLGYGEGDFPTAEKIAKEELSLPMYPELPREDLELVAELINEYKSKR